MRRFGQYAATLVELIGCDLSPVHDLITARGARELLQTWHRTAPGSHRQLQLALGLLDPRVSTSWSIQVQRDHPRPTLGRTGVLGFGIRPGQRELTVLAVWRRPRLGARAHCVARVLRAVVSAWAPADIDRIRTQMAWRQGFVPVSRREPK